MKLLAIETATEACSAALLIDDSITARAEIAPQQHTRLILPMVDELLTEAGITISNLDAIAFGQGPGAFTGVRIAIGVVQGLAFAHNLPVIPVSSMAALAQQFTEEYSNIAVAIDARMGEVYWGQYQLNDGGIMQLLAEEAVLSPNEVKADSNQKWFGAGTGWGTYEKELSQQFNDNLIGFSSECFPLAKYTLQIAKTKLNRNEIYDASNAEPVYLRNKVVG